MKVSVAAAFALTVVTCRQHAFAQVVATEPERPLPATVAAQLRSSEPKHVAWGAFLAGELRVPELVPALLTCLERPELERPELEWNAARRAVLDAVIRNGVQPALDILVRLYSKAPNEVLVLLSKPQVGRDAALLTLVKSESGAAWLAMAGWMTEHRTTGFAAFLLRDLPLLIEITVKDRDCEGGGYGSGYGAGIGHGVLHPAPGYPPIPCYKLWTTAVRGATVLSEGPHPVYYTRSQGQPDTIGACGSGMSVEAPSTQQRLDFLADLGNFFGSELQAVQHATVEWTTAQRLRADATRLRRQIQAAYDEVVAALVRAGAVTEAESATLFPRIGIELRVRRCNRSVPLPAVSGDSQDHPRR